MGLWIALTITAILNFHQTDNLGKRNGEFAAAQLLLQSREGLKTLILDTGSKDPSVRRDATFGLGMSDDIGAFPTLLKLLSDQDGAVATAARRGINNSFYVDQPALVQAAKTPPRNSALQALDILYNFPNREPAIYSIAADARSPVRTQALNIFARRPEGFNLSVEALSDPRPEVQATAATIAFHLAKSPTQREIISRLAQKGSPAIRLAFGNASDDHYAETPSWLAEILAKDSLVENRKHATTWFLNHFRWNGKPEYFAEITNLLNDPNPSVGELVIESFSEEGGSTGTRPEPLDLQKFTDQTTANRFKDGLAKFLPTKSANQAAVALAYVQDNRGWNVLTQMLKVSDPNTQWPAILAFGQLRDRRAVPLLLPLTANGNLLEYSLRSIGRIGDPAAIPPLIFQMKLSWDNWRNQLIARAIKSINPQADSTEILQYAKSVESDPIKQSSYLEALGILGGEANRQFLTERTTAPQVWVSFSAVRGLALMKDPEADQTLAEIQKGSNRELAKTAKEALQTRQMPQRD